MKIMKKTLLPLTLLSILTPSAFAGEVNVYSYRQEFLTKPLFDAFTKETGHNVNVVFAKKGLIERVKTEGKNSPADVIMTVDISNLNKIKSLGIAQSVSTKNINKNIPASMRDVDGTWFGLSQRSRVLYTSKDRVAVGSIKTYADLADPKWNGKICMRSATHKYNVGLTAYMLTRHGESFTKNWLKGLEANLARDPKGNDRAQVKAVFEGICDIAIANDYYYGKMLANKDQKAWADSVNIVWPDQAGNGVHVNLAGIAVAKYAPNKDIAVTLVEFLSSKKAQEIYASVNNERPVNDSVSVSDKVKSWHKDLDGKLKIDGKVSLSDIAKNAKNAILLINESGLNK